MSDDPQTPEEAGRDDQEAVRLLSLVYDELRRLAASWLATEKAGQTLQATALVHEAYLRLADGQGIQNWNGKAHFFGAAAKAMRRILVDNARRKRRPKHGGDRRRVELEVDVPDSGSSLDIQALDEALTRLAVEEPRKAKLVELRYFAGLSLEEAAACLAISEATAKRDWAVARAWLFDQLADE